MWLFVSGGVREHDGDFLSSSFNILIDQFFSPLLSLSVPPCSLSFPFFLILFLFQMKESESKGKERREKEGKERKYGGKKTKTEMHPRKNEKGMLETNTEQQ